MAKQKMKRTRIQSKVLVMIIAGIFVLMLILSSPFFTIREVVIVGNEQLTDTQIYTETGIEIGKNIFHINRSRARKNLLANAYVKDVKITTAIPNSVTIQIEERKVRGYVRHEGSGNFLLIDIDGRVLDVRNVMPFQLPVIAGLKFSGFTVGEVLRASNEIEFRIVVELSRLLEKHEILEIVNLDVTDRDDIRLYINDAEFRFGTFDNAYEKISLTRAILEKWPEGSVGTVDITDIKRNPIFDYVT